MVTYLSVAGSLIITLLWVYCRVCQWTSFENWSRFDGVTAVSLKSNQIKFICKH